MSDKTGRRLRRNDNPATWGPHLRPACGPDGRVLRSWRAQCGLTQGEAAALLGLAKRTVNRVEAGVPLPRSAALLLALVREEGEAAVERLRELRAAFDAGTLWGAPKGDNCPHCGDNGPQDVSSGNPCGNCANGDDCPRGGAANCHCARNRDRGPDCARE